MDRLVGEGLYQLVDFRKFGMGCDQGAQAVRRHRQYYVAETAVFRCEFESIVGGYGGPSAPEMSTYSSGPDASSAA